MCKNAGNIFPPVKCLTVGCSCSTFKSRLWVLRHGPPTGLRNWQSIPRSAGQSASFNSRPLLFGRTHKLHPSPDHEPLRYASTYRCVYVRRTFVKPQPHCMNVCTGPSVGSSSYCTLHLLTQWNIFCLLLLSSSPPDPIGYEVIGQCRKSARLFLWDLCSDVGHRVEFNLWW